MSVFSNNLLLGAGGQSTGPAPFDPTLIGNSVWLDGSADFLKRDNFTLSADGKKEFIFSMWIKRNEFGRTQTHFDLFPTGHTSYNEGSHFIFQPDDQLEFSVVNNGSTAGQKVSSAMYRDIGWYHVLISYNTNAAIAAASRLKLFVNGLEITDTSVNNTPPDNESCIGGGTGNADLRIGRTDHSGIPYPPDVYFAQACYLEGKSFQAGDYAITDFLDAFTLGTNGSQYAPKSDADIAALATTVGGNSFCLDFANSSDLGNDISANNNDFTPNSMSSANQSSSTPSLVYPTLNTLDKNSAATLSSGNLRYSSSSSVYHGVRSTFWIDDTTPKIYWEATYVSGGGSSTDPIGLADYEYLLGQLPVVNGTAVFYTNTKGSTASFSNETVQTYNTASYDADTGDVLRFAYDPATKKLWVGNATNGTYLGGGDPATDSTPTATLTIKHPCSPAVGRFGTLGTTTYDFNFGQTAFTGTVPTGFVSLNSANLTAPDYQGIDYFDATLYEGNGTGQRVGDFVPFTDLYNVANSIIFDVTTKNHLQRTMSAAASDSNKQFTLSAWVKRVNPNQTFSLVLLESTDGSGANGAGIRIGSGSGGGAFQLYAQGSGVTGTNVAVHATQKSGQTSSWQHFLCQVDTTQATASDRVKLYVDGVLMAVDNGSGGAAAYPDQDAVFYLGDNDFATQIGKIPYGAYYNSMYLAEHAFVTGTNSTSKTISDYGSLDTATNRWIPKDISGFTFGHNGSYLEFQTTPGSGSGAGTDTSGNSNNWTEAINGSALAWTSYTNYQTIDTPSKNYNVFDPTYKTASSLITVSEGNLQCATTGNDSLVGTLHFPVLETGCYWEAKVTSAGDEMMGLWVDSTTPLTNYSGGSPHLQTASCVIRVAANVVYNEGTPTSFTPSTISSGDILMFAYKNGQFFYGKNGSWENSGDPANETGELYTIAGSASKTIVPVFGRSGASNVTYVLNFGQQSGGLSGSSTTFNAAADGYFVYTPPTGYKALNQDNLDDTQSKITAWAWIKNRDSTDSHILVDRVRGVGEVIHSNETAAETTEPNTVQRFLQRGVQVGSDVQVNTANESYVLWQWLVGDSATTGSTTAPAGTIASTSIAADAGHFSVGTYTGQTAAGTVGHGLGGVAEMVIVWDKGFANSIAVYHVGAASDAETDYLLLNQTDAATDDATFWNDTAPTSSVFSVGTGNNTNGNTRPKSFLAFRSVAGVCKVGSYNGNSNANGPYLSLGFKPAWWMVKCSSFSDASHHWFVADSARYTFNGTTTAGGLNGGTLEANNSTAEEAHSTNFGQNPAFDFLADGIKLRSNSGTINATGRTYIYLAMADIGGNGTLPPVYGR